MSRNGVGASRPPLDDDDAAALLDDVQAGPRSPAGAPTKTGLGEAADDLCAAERGRGRPRPAGSFAADAHAVTTRSPRTARRVRTRLSLAKGHDRTPQ